MCEISGGVITKCSKEICYINSVLFIVEHHLVLYLGRRFRLQVIRNSGHSVYEHGRSIHIFLVKMLNENNGKERKGIGAGGYINNIARWAFSVNRNVSHAPTLTCFMIVSCCTDRWCVIRFAASCTYTNDLCIPLPYITKFTTDLYF